MSHFFSTARTVCALTLTLTLAVGPAAAAPFLLADDQTALPDQSAELTDDPPAELTDSQSQQVDTSAVSQYLYYSPRLLALGYSQEVVDQLFSAVSPSDVLPLLRLPYDSRLGDYLSQPGFRGTRLGRYLTYAQANPDFTPEQVVLRVNIGLDGEAYSDVQQVSDPGAVDVLVNKYNSLGESFVPELVQLDGQYASYSTACLQPEAYEWFVKMVDAARADGLRLYCVSAYRSYSYQNTLYQNYVSKSGRALADIYSARPGYSEHQTGLTVDINTASRSAHFENTAQYRWLCENSWKYGYILRYPKDKEDVTGFIFEPWHYRYVGVELAKAVYESGLSYDEYVTSQPEGSAAAQSLTALGRSCTLWRAPLRLNGVYYLTASDLARALRLDLSQPDAGTAVLSSPNGRLTLTSFQTRCTLGSIQAELSSVPFVQDGQMLVPLADAVHLLGLSLEESDGVLNLTYSFTGSLVQYVYNM